MTCTDHTHDRDDATECPDCGEVVTCPDAHVCITVTADPKEGAPAVTDRPEPLIRVRRNYPFAGHQWRCRCCDRVSGRAWRHAKTLADAADKGREHLAQVHTQPLVNLCFDLAHGFACRPGGAKAGDLIWLQDQGVTIWKAGQP